MEYMIINSRRGYGYAQTGGKLNFYSSDVIRRALPYAKSAYNLGNQIRKSPLTGKYLKDVYISYLSPYVKEYLGSVLGKEQVQLAEEIGKEILKSDNVKEAFSKLKNKNKDKIKDKIVEIISPQITEPVSLSQKIQGAGLVKRKRTYRRRN